MFNTAFMALLAGDECAKYMEFLKKEWSHENLEFWKKVYFYIGYTLSTTHTQLHTMYHISLHMTLTSTYTHIH